MSLRTITSDSYASFQVRDGETVLTASLRAGVTLPFSCRGGTCQTCMHRAVEGTVPARAQRGLSAVLAGRHYFLPCVCEPLTDMHIALPDPADLLTECLLESIDLDADPPGLQLEPTQQMKVTTGDAIEVQTDDGWLACGTVVSPPEESYYLVLALPAGDAAAQDFWRTRSTGELVTVRRATPAASPPVDRGRPPLDPALWVELDDGRVARAVLDHFYTSVFADPLLAPYFRGVTREHVAGKQYSFMYKAMTGKDVYFGESPRDAHHWMVISDELFDYRQNLMRAALQAHHLSEDQIRRWMAFELPHRSAIVKDVPLPRMRFGVEAPLEGYGEEVLSVGAVCDGCGTILEPGDKVRFHLRLGTVSCARCNGAA